MLNQGKKCNLATSYENFEIVGCCWDAILIQLRDQIWKCEKIFIFIFSIHNANIQIITFIFNYIFNYCNSLNHIQCNMFNGPYQMWLQCVSPNSVHRNSCVTRWAQRIEIHDKKPKQTFTSLEKRPNERFRGFGKKFSVYFPSVNTLYIVRKWDPYFI